MDGIVRLEELLALRPSPIFFECVSGSRAYGTATATSDEDIRGIFAVPAASTATQHPAPQDTDTEALNVILRKWVDT